MKIPNAVTHILVPLIAVELYRDYAVKNKRRFPLHYVLIAGLAGLLPDIDVLIYWIINGFSNVGLNEIHRTFTHSLFFPLIFLVLSLVFWKVNIKFFGKHKLKLDYVFFLLGFGAFVHILLDFLLSGYVMPIYPFSADYAGLNLLGGSLEGTLISGLDAILLAGWLIHEELKHKISGFF